MLLLLFFLLGTFSQLTSAQDAAFTAIDVRKSIKIATTILELSAKLEASDEAPSEEQFLTLLANALESEHNEGQPINRDIFNLHPKEKTAIQSVDGGAMFLALSKNTKFDDLKNDPALQKELNDLIAKQKEMSGKLAIGGTSTALIEAKVQGTTWAKIGVWTTGAILFPFTGGVSLAVAGGINAAISGGDVVVKVYKGDHKGAAASATAMALGLLIPGAGAALDSSVDVATDVGLDLLVDVDPEIIVDAVDALQGAVVGEAVGHAANALGLLQEDNNHDEVVSLKTFRKVQELHQKIKAERRMNTCYFAYVERKDGVKDSFANTKLPHNLHCLKKLQREEQALVAIWHNFKTAFAGDVAKLEETYDAELATCRHNKNTMGARLGRARLNLRRTQSLSSLPGAGDENEKGPGGMLVGESSESPF